MHNKKKKTWSKKLPKLKFYVSSMVIKVFSWAMAKFSSVSQGAIICFYTPSEFVSI